MLNLVALFLLLAVLVIVFYGVIAIHGIPADIAKARQHPHQDAIAAACWVSLLFLGVLWPFLWIWAMMYRPDRGWGFGATAKPAAELEARVAALEAELAARSKG
jgi:glucan phosphoethanolaminetransferase (alkaline phosphatase superfamily)